MATQSKQKRGPTVLVTDSRDVAHSQRPSMLTRQSTKLISVDNVLQYASEIPSGQRRGPVRPASHGRTPSGRHPLDPRLSGRTLQQHLPARTSKVTEKLVLLPETESDADEKDAFVDDEDEDSGPPRDEAYRDGAVGRGKSYAERLPKASRTDKLSRVTAYCTAQSYKMQATAEFVRLKHGAKTKLYDDCLYTVYHLPLLAGNDGYRIRSSPVLKSAGGKAVLDEEIERHELHEYQEGFFGEEEYGVRGQESPRRGSRSNSDDASQEQPLLEDNAVQENENPLMPIRSPSAESSSELASLTSTYAEMFIFSYGVVVFWNFTERQEKDILADLAFSSERSSLKDGGAPGVSLAVRPLQEEDFETEDLHFQYDASAERPRLFNDIITLRTGDHMIKLTMSHAIAQSTKLSFFESRMADTMLAAQPVPRRLALEGELGLKREEVVRILGRLFMSRVDVNLSSNMLDTPNFFWDSEPTLHPLYTAVREYLEIKPRIQVLNERCRVFLDLAEILSDSVADRKMSRLNWIVIVLIVLSIVVTCSEVVLRFGILSSGKGGKKGGSSGNVKGDVLGAARGVQGMQMQMGFWTPG